MPRASFFIRIGATTVTADVLSATIFRGRDNYLDSINPSTLVMTLDNHLGKYAPKSPYIITGCETFGNVTVRSLSPEVVTFFDGIITKIEVNASPKKQTVTIHASDSLEILKRKLVDRRIMTDQPTGLIMHRILDYLDGEEGPNAAWEIGDVGALPGYVTALGSASVLIQTADPLFEGSRRVQMTLGGGLSSSDGMRYNLESLGMAASTVVYVTLYCLGYDPTDDGKDITIALVTDSGTDGSTTGTLNGPTGDWSRFTLQATYSGNANPRITVTGSSDNPLGVHLGILHVRTNAYGSPVLRDIDHGDMYLPYNGSFRRPISEDIEEIRDNELGGLFYISGAGGTYTFRAGSARYSYERSTASQGTIDGDFWDIDYSEDSLDRISKVSFSYRKFEVGAEGTYLWNLDLPTSRLIAANGTEIIWAPYGFFADKVSRPEPNYDYRLNEAAAGTSTDLTGAAYSTLDWESYAQGSKLTVRVGATAAYITQMAIRGRPIRPSSDNPIIEYTPTNPPDAVSELDHDYTLNDNADAVQNWAGQVGEFFDDQVEHVSVTLRPKTTEILSHMLLRDISDRVTLKDDAHAYSTQINGDYYIESIRHNIRKGGFLHETVWALTPAE